MNQSKVAACHWLSQGHIARRSFGSCSRMRIERTFQSSRQPCMYLITASTARPSGKPSKNSRLLFKQLVDERLLAQQVMLAELCQATELFASQADLSRTTPYGCGGSVV